MHTDGPWLRDEQGRTLILRGVNLGGSSKVPCNPDGATHLSQGFFNHRNVSFVGRPFPLAEANEHFSRLQKWGFNLLRLLVTWEAVEHAGPGQYDQEYLDYLYAITQKAGEHGLDVLIDPHQDAWSRFSGGDGAPGWTLEAAGLDLTQFAATGAAIVHQMHGDPFPRMVWPTNVYKLASATMFTLFFAGNDFAPLARVDGEPIQEFLQHHYLAAIQQVALRLKELPNVVGYDTFNEPSGGYVDCQRLDDPAGRLKLRDAPSPYQSMLLASGISQEIEVWKLGRLRLQKAGKHRVNIENKSAWLPGRECIWQQHGVWGFDRQGVPHLLCPDYFSQVHGHPVDFNQDYLLPFVRRCTQAMRAADPRALIFFETESEYRLPRWDARDVGGIVYAPHWYDGLTLITKRFNRWVAYDTRRSRPVFGAGRVRKLFAEQLAAHKSASSACFGGIPVLIGEIGIPFDLEQGRAYHSGKFSDQVKAMDRSLRAVEDNLLGCCVWNYTSDNSNTRGDQWNGEDFSIFSRDQQTDPENPDSGGRALEALLRPYAGKVAGEPLDMSFDAKSKVFRFTFRHDSRVSAPTEIYTPAYQYPHGVQVDVSDGSYEIDAERQLLRYSWSRDREVHSIQIHHLSDR